MTRRQWLVLVLVNVLVSCLVAAAVVWASVRIGWILPANQATPFVIVPSTATPRPSDTPTGPATPSPTVETEAYVVQPGDTLLAIAIRLDVDPALLLAINDLDNADRLLVGQELLVPKGSLPTATPTEPATDTPTVTWTATPAPPATATATATATASLTATVSSAAARTVTVVPSPLVIVEVVTPGELADEAVVLANRGNEIVQLRNWSLKRPDDSRRYVFPGFQLLPGAEVRVHTGPGSDDQENLYWALGEPVWGQASAVVLDNQAGDPVAVLPLGE